MAGFESIAHACAHAAAAAYSLYGAYSTPDGSAFPAAICCSIAPAFAAAVAHANTAAVGSAVT